MTFQTGSNREFLQNSFLPTAVMAKLLPSKVRK